jgi:hypothetical protein
MFLGAVHAELLSLLHDVPSISLGPFCKSQSINAHLIRIASFEAFHPYQQLFRDAFPTMSKNELNSMLMERANTRIFTLIDQHDHFPHKGCQISGHLCAINGTQPIFDDVRYPEEDLHTEFVTQKTKLMFNPRQIDTICAPGVEYSLQSAASGNPFRASCHNIKFYN